MISTSHRPCDVVASALVERPVSRRNTRRSSLYGSHVKYYTASASVSRAAFPNGVYLLLLGMIKADDVTALEHLVRIRVVL